MSSKGELGNYMSSDVVLASHVDHGQVRSKPIVRLVVELRPNGGRDFWQDLHAELVEAIQSLPDKQARIDG